ncbi:hypothetical protein EYR41_008532 [Orbilia oligospora]|uniref:Uncharacterized protein n=1 Tax=Orbilia oligospora TaxID=2813651 RepID=A0A8H2HHI0_ORBOL|nr:hypothetical protein EYR41_008532 [Orbilia oligospora]
MDSLHLTRFLNIYRDLLFGRRGESFPVTLSWHGEGLMNEMMNTGFFRVRVSGKGNHSRRDDGWTSIMIVNYYIDMHCYSTSPRAYWLSQVPAGCAPNFQNCKIIGSWQISLC